MGLAGIQVTFQEYLHRFPDLLELPGDREVYCNQNLGSGPTWVCIHTTRGNIC